MRTNSENHRFVDLAETQLRQLSDNRLASMRQLNRVYQVGRMPAVVVGTHALYAYETAAGVRVQSGAMTKQNLDLLFDVRKLRAFTTLLKRSEVQSLIAVLQRADKTFAVRRDKLETAVNDTGFEMDIIRRMQAPGDPHPLRLSDDENDFWAGYKPTKASKWPPAPNLNKWWFRPRAKWPPCTL